MNLSVRGLIRSSVLVAGLTVTSLALIAQGPDPMVGTWKLNVSKSDFNPGPPPKEATLVIKQVGDKRSSALSMELSTGRKIQFEYTATQDGTDAPVPGGGLVDTVSERRINPRTVSRDDKKDGKVTRHQYSVLSNDGKTLRVEIATINAQGVPVNDVQVYEKQ
jgi:hypothetical protein